MSAREIADRIMDADGWLPIEGAPKDGTPIIVGQFNSLGYHDFGGVIGARWSVDYKCWRAVGTEEEIAWPPTHYRPLPAPPSTLKETEDLTMTARETADGISAIAKRITNKVWLSTDQAMTLARDIDAALIAERRAGVGVLALSPAPETDGWLPEEREALEALLGYSRATAFALDESETLANGDQLIDASMMRAVNDAYDRIEALPDDQPGFTTGIIAKAEWALRRKLPAPPSTPKEGS